MANPDIKTSKDGVTQDLPECPLCKTDGHMEGKLINDTTYMWICSTCPAILFEFYNHENSEDVMTYLECDRDK